MHAVLWTVLFLGGVPDPPGVLAIPEPREEIYLVQEAEPCPPPPLAGYPRRDIGICHWWYKHPRKRVEAYYRDLRAGYFQGAGFDYYHQMDYPWRPPTVPVYPPRPVVRPRPTHELPPEPPPLTGSLQQRRK